MIEPHAEWSTPIVCAIGKGGDDEDFVSASRAMQTTPHEAQNVSRRSSTIDSRATRQQALQAPSRGRMRIDAGLAFASATAANDVVGLLKWRALARANAPSRPDAPRARQIALNLRLLR